MLFKGILLATFAAGIFAVPTPALDDVSKFFVSMSDSRVVGGDVAPEGSAPWMVSLTSGAFIRSAFCGASLISERDILTAAHCIDNVYSSWTGLSSSLRAVVGTNRWSTGGTQYTIKSNATHPHYVKAIIKNDIGVLTTVNKVVLTPKIQPVSLSYEFVGAEIPVRITGWGTIRYLGPASAVLLELYTKTLDGATCNKDVQAKATELGSWAPEIEDHIELCTYHSNGHGNCHGDSGGPLVRTDTNEQVGVVSWGFPCAVGAPDMFARVSGFKSFIEDAKASA